ncbi:transcriptional regulator, MarR family [Methanococcus vannielii SB]|jgi:DNA-binding MarR family transcriptional regulator|uniref:Transcriptional regulator, MarR family n=1 Tax=Methanococcus vannielii (strain ATCC 35089 / DSM 1224 / JCM 13029 / OCM 148 / SB) TaxID=406327 RepID=A6UNY2_METVS|nr:MarR family transcriptional regulator [Methanococcus vannielii]ABR54204.1 transcriptional regulator, MarR family [Methanococcus vannielii SB]
MKIEESIDIISKYVCKCHEEHIKKILDEKDINKLTMSQILYLEVIYEFKNPTFRQIAEKLNVSKPSVTAAIQKLIHTGYVEKKQSIEDKREYHLILTKKGHMLVNVNIDAHNAFINKIKEILDNNEFEIFQKHSEKLAKKLQELK